MNLPSSIPIASAILAIFSLLPSVQAQTVIPAETEFRVKLLSPIDTRTSKKDDSITAQVLAPPEFAGSMMEGKIRQSQGGKKIKGKSVLSFAFEKLHHKDRQVNISSSLKSVSNSQGKENVDEEGQVVKKSNQLGKAAAAAGAGALVGAVLGGGRGAAIGAGVGAAAALVFIQFGTEGANMSFAAGSEFVLSVKQR